MSFIRRRLRRTGLWKHRDFVNLWAAETVSQFGTQITLLALPLAAALTLDATAGQMGVLAAAGTLPALLIGLFVGVWVDRLPRRPVMIACDIGRAGLLAVIPVTWALDALRIELLYAVAFCTGVLTVFFDVAYMSLLPSLVERERIIEGNSKLQASASTAQVGGPGIAGVLVGLITAPYAILADAISFLLSAAFIGRIRATEPTRRPVDASTSVRREISEGLRVVWHSTLLRAMTLANSCSTLFGYVFLAVYVLYMVDDLGFSPTSVGLVLGLGGVGALLGATLAAPAARVLGVGPAIVAGRVLFGLGGLAVVFAFSVPGFEVPLVLFAEFFQWMVLIVADINQISLRQAITPDRLLGRVNATMRFAIGGAIPIGSLLGGALGDAIGLRATLLVGVFGMLAACLFALVSPLRSLRDLPPHVDEDVDAVGAGAMLEPEALSPAS